MKYLEISSGVQLPFIGLGTWLVKGKVCSQVVKEAYSLGYRHFDTALFYENQEEIGQALAGCKDIFLTSKFMPFHLDQMSVEEACHISLKQLKRNYLDLFLLHYPDRTRDMAAIIYEMKKLLDKGMVRAIGVSNFTLRHLEEVGEAAFLLSVNQVEYHPYLNQKELLEGCRKQNISLIAFRTLGKGALTSDPLLVRMGKKYEKSAAQIALRFVLEKGLPVIPKSLSRAHLQENLSLYSFSLEKEDFQLLDNLPPKPRFCIGDLSDFDD